MKFGKALRHRWLLEENVTFLNHGSYGATPIPVLEQQAAWRRQLEAQPVRFMQRELPEALRAAADRLAQFLGAQGQDLVFVENATSAVNTVLGSLRFSPGDEILATSHVYGAVRNAINHTCQQTEASLVELPLPFPCEDPARILEVLESVLARHTQIKLAILDHVTSPSALVLPIEEMIKCCHRRGVPVLVDGAHAPGMLPLQLDKLGAEWYTGNAHKWLFTPKGCAFLWARRDVQEQLHPTVISHGYGSGFLAEFDWIGTRDPTAWLSVTAALDYLEELGVEAVRSHNHELVLWAARHLLEMWGLSFSITETLVGSMVSIPLPISVPISAQLEQAQAVYDDLTQNLGIEVPVLPLDGQIIIRLSSQVYNYPEEYIRLGTAIQNLVMV